MNNVWITRLLQAGIGKKIAKNFHKKHSGILTELEDILRGRSLYDESMRNSHSLMPGFIFCMDVEVSSCMAHSLSSFFFLLSQFFHLLSPQFTGTWSRILKLLQTAVARPQHRMMPDYLCAKPSASWTSQPELGGKKPAVFPCWFLTICCLVLFCIVN